MKRFLRVLILFLLFPVISFGQLDGSGVAPNFTLTDIDGLSHTLYNYLDQDKVVVLDFFATWCGACLNNSSAVEEIWAEHGPEGDNTIMMFLIESDDKTSSLDLQEFITNHNVTSTIFDDAEAAGITSLYNIGYYPTYYIVYPDRSYKEVTGNETTIGSKIKAAIAEGPGLSTTTYDARVLEFEDPKGSLCGNSINPVVTIQNYGIETMTSLDIKSEIDGNIEATYNWTGSLAQYEIEEVTLSEITSIADGKHDFIFKLESPNGQTDVDLTNNNQNSPFRIILDGTTITVQMYTDGFPAETSWAILDGDEVFYSNGGYSKTNTIYTEDVCVYTDSCYTFVIYDSYGDGNSGNPVEISLNGYTLGSITDFSSGNSASVDFCAVSSTTDIKRDVLSINLNVYPNPFSDNLNLNYPNPKNELAVIEIYNQIGILVKTVDVENQIVNNDIEINTQDMSNGIYYISLKLGDNRTSKKVILLR